MSQVWTYAQYVVLVLVGILVLDLILDRVRAIFGKPQDEGLARALEIFDQFCDHLRRIVGAEPLAGMTREQVAFMAGVAYDVAERFLSPVWTREQWVEAVLAWYDQQIQVENMVAEAYAQASVRFVDRRPGASW